jgi:hypothetical protein
LEDAVGLKEMFAEVLEALEEAQVPDALREAAFMAGVRVLSAAPQLSDDTTDSGALRRPRAAVSIAGKPIEAIAAKLGLELEAVAEVFHDDGGKLGIGVAPAKLAKGHAAATKQIALLLASGRQAGGYDDAYTRVSEIREMCRDFGRLDPGNFSTTVTEMTQDFTFKGKGQTRQVHVTKPGWANARDLVMSLTSGG